MKSPYPRGAPCPPEELGLPDDAWYELGTDGLYHPYVLAWRDEGVSALTDIMTEIDDYVDTIYVRGPQL